MKAFLFVILVSIGFAGCSEEGGPPREYHFASKQEYLKDYLPLQKKHGGVKKWVPYEDADWDRGKLFTLADGFQAIFCPANGDEDLFK